MRAAANVVAGGLGVSVPAVGKQCNRTRAGYRKTDRRREPQVIRRLRAAGCEPREVMPGQWFAWCPSCLLEGRRAVLEIRRAADGVLIVACSEAHERRRAA